MASRYILTGDWADRARARFRLTPRTRRDGGRWPPWARTLAELGAWALWLGTVLAILVTYGPA